MRTRRNIFVDESKVVTDFGLCPPARPISQAAVSYGLETNAKNPAGGWSIRLDDLVLFAR